MSESSRVDLQEYAARWLADLSELERLRTKDADGSWRSRLVRLATRRSRALKREWLIHEMSVDELHLKDRGAGSDRVWGVLSSVSTDGDTRRSLILEDTLRSASEQPTASAELRGTIERTLQVVPLVRAQAAIGVGNDLVAQLEDRVLELAQSPQLSAEIRRRLTDHLPARCRPPAPDYATGSIATYMGPL